MAIHVGEYRISLDMKDADANLNFVSHAHSDHTAGVRKNSDILCSEITRDLVQTRTKFGIRSVATPKNVELLDSGHMFGAKQLYATYENGGTIVYTGDYQLQRSPVAEKIEIKKADALIIDSTYPLPDVVFDEKEEVITAMQHYINAKMSTGSVLFGAYSMGKAQELIRICNEIGIAPIVDGKIAMISEIYSKHGMKLDFSTKELGSAVADDDFREPVWIVSMHKFDTVRGIVASMNRKVFTAIATGFAMTQRFNTDVQFALSDHADFKQAIEYIEQCSPKQIYTRGQGSYVFAENLKAKGYNAQPLRSAAQMASLLTSYF